MENDLEPRIRQRAYEIWESEGRSGNPEDHWSRAEQELKVAGGTQGQEAAEVTKADDKMTDQLGDFA
jgi:hypothetical protein